MKTLNEILKGKTREELERSYLELEVLKETLEQLRHEKSMRQVNKIVFYSNFAFSSINIVTAILLVVYS